MEDGAENEIVEFSFLFCMEGVTEWVRKGVVHPQVVYHMEGDVVLEAPVLKEDGLRTEELGSGSTLLVDMSDNVAALI